MNLRRILNILIVIAVIGAISGVFIIFYNNSKLEDKEFKSTNEEVLDSSNDNDEYVDSKTEDNKDIDDTDSTKDSGVIKKESAVSENEITVESTSSSKNRVIAIVGSMIVILGIRTIIFRTNN